jgi:hypothetical protein
MPPLNPRPYEAGNALAEHVEDVTGDTAEAYDLTAAVPVIVTDPVRVEEHGPRYLTAETFAIPDASPAVRIAPANRTRARLHITPNDTVNTTGVLIGGPGVTPSTGFLVPHLTTVVLHTTGEVWALPVIGDAVSVSVLAEHRDG